MNKFYHGIALYINAIKFISKNKMWVYFIFPLLFNLLIFFTGIYAINNVSNIIIDSLKSYLHLDVPDFWLVQVINGFIEVTVWLILKIILFFILTYFSAYIVLILMIPVLSHLSEKSYRILTGDINIANQRSLLYNIFRGIILAFRNIVIELLLLVLILIASLILSFFPGIGLAGGIIIQILFFVLAAYFYGFSFLDFSLERKGLSIRKSIDYVRQNKGITIGLGTVFTAFSLIPFVGMFLCGFLSIPATVAATMVSEEKK